MKLRLAAAADWRMIFSTVGRRAHFRKHRVNATRIYIDSESLMNHAIAGGSIQFTTSWIIFQ